MWAKKTTPPVSQRNDTVAPGQAQGKKSSKNNGSRKTSYLLCTLVALLLVAGVPLALRLAEYDAARREYEVYAALTEAPASVAVQPDGSQEGSAATGLDQALPPDPAETPAPQTRQPNSGAKAVDAPTPSPTPRRFYSAKVSALRRDNSDMVCWLEIPGTSIAYPVVQTDDNEYYVEHTFQKKENASGAIFMDCWNTKDFSDFNTVIYGHNMKDGSMFAPLREYEYQSFAKEHLFIEVTQYDARQRYQVFAAYVSQGEDEADFRAQGAVSDHDRSAFLHDVQKRSIIKSDLVVGKDDRLLTLATCTSGRHPWYFVVHAVLVEEQLWAEEK